MKRLQGLDALRGVAAVAVLLHHTIGSGRGYLAVDFFFMLSGYVMARTFEPRMKNSLAPSKFLALRWKRLAPVLAIGTVIGWPLITLQVDSIPLCLLIGGANLLVVPSLATAYLYPGNTPVWSAFYELIANFIHAVILWKIQKICFVAAVLFAVLATITLAVGSLDVGYGATTIGFGIVRALAPYCLGILLYRGWMDVPRFAPPLWVAFAAFPALVLAPPLGGMASSAFDLFFVAIICPALVAAGLKSSPSFGSYLGRLSFPLYAVHSPIVVWLHLAGFGFVVATIVPIALTIAGLAFWDCLNERRKLARIAV